MAGVAAAPSLFPQTCQRASPNNHLMHCERFPMVACYPGARAGGGGAVGDTNRSDNDRLSLCGLKGLAETFDSRVPPVGGADVNDDHMVILLFDLAIKTRRHIRTPPGG